MKGSKHMQFERDVTSQNYWEFLQIYVLHEVPCGPFQTGMLGIAWHSLRFRGRPIFVASTQKNLNFGILTRWEVVRSYKK